MRRVVLKSMLAATGLGLAATAATALSMQPPAPYDQALTLAGGETAIDPDAPIATARYGDTARRPVSTAAVVDLAGAPTATPLAGGPTPPPPIQTLSAPRAAPAARIETASVTRAPAPVQGLVRSSPRRVQVSKVEDIQIRPFTPQGDSAAFVGGSIDASSLIGKMRPNSRDARKGRWILFAAASGKALSLNVIKDSIVGWRTAGWAEERVARQGTHQLGMGWRKNGRQLSLSATRRSLRTQDYSDRDMVYGVSLSLSGR